MNSLGILVLPGPYLLQEFLASQIMPGNPLLAQLLLHLRLGGNARMIGSGQPKGIETLHPLRADQNILQREIERMPNVQHPRYIRRRDDNAIRFCFRTFAGFKEAMLHPVSVPFLFCRLRIICGRHVVLFAARRISLHRILHIRQFSRFVLVISHC
ncbi:hypothetical protein D3C73_607890 [compost metagenome]